MDESEIHNEGPVQEQNIVQNQYIAQHIYNAGDNVTLSARLAQAWKHPHQRDFFADEAISDYEYSRQDQRTSLFSQRPPRDPLTSLQTIAESRPPEGTSSGR